MKRSVLSISVLAAICLHAVSFGQTRSKIDDADLLTFQISVAPADSLGPVGPSDKAIKVRRGELARLQITGSPKQGFHTYPVTKRTSAQELGYLTRLKYGDSKALAPLWPIHETEPETVDEGSSLGPYFEHEKPFVLTQDVLVLANAPPGRQVLQIDVVTQVCNKETCIPKKFSLRAELEVSDEPPLALPPEVVARLDETRPEVIVVPVTSPAAPAKSEQASPKPAPSAPSTSNGLISGTHEEYKAAIDDIISRLVHSDQKTPLDLMAFMLAGVFWGAVSLITPCVFPMIPITVSFFLKQSEKEHHRPVTMAVVYSLTIVIVLTLAAAFLLSAFRWLSINPIMNYALGGLFIFFALSLFGMYEIELPSGLARFTSSKEGKGGMVGTIFMALTFTIISFACVAPFLGGFGGTVGTMARPWWHNILGGLAFAATFASPFFLLALFPTLLRKMPKSGSWLNSVKVVMGFLELAAAFKFFRAAELVQSASVTLFTFDLVLGVWIALCCLAGLYLLGIYRLPHDTAEEYIGVPSLLFAGLFLGMGVYLLPALFKDSRGESHRPTGAVYAWVDSFLLPDAPASPDIKSTGNLAYAIAQAREIRERTGKPQRIFLDFTGKSCTNCKKNERSVFAKATFQKLFQNYIVAQVYTDVVPAEFYSPEIRAQFASDASRLDADAEVNANLEDKAFGSIQLPLYAVIEPQLDGKITVFGPYEEGLINNEAAFAEFLREPK